LIAGFGGRRGSRRVRLRTRIAAEVSRAATQEQAGHAECRSQDEPPPGQRVRQPERKLRVPAHPPAPADEHQDRTEQEQAADPGEQCGQPTQARGPLPQRRRLGSGHGTLLVTRSGASVATPHPRGLVRSG
jgi:hypothetical protein